MAEEEKEMKMLPLDRSYSDLDDRKKKILRAIIANYLQTGEPVGSRTISKMPELKLSSATIRNEMADLEELGYIVQPHTSAGRVPTDKGYRFYVDTMMAEKTETEKSQGVLLKRVDRLETLLMQVAKVLAYNTQYATMVTSPRFQNKQVKFIQLSQVDDEELVAVIVVGDNVARNQLIHVNRPLSNEEVLKFNVLLNTFLQGISVDQINIELMQTMKKEAGDGEYGDILEKIFEGIVDAVHQAEQGTIYTSGASNILKYNGIDDVDKASEFLEAFEDKRELGELADKTLKSGDGDDGIQIYIGDEAPLEKMKDYSIVTSTYELPEGAKGTIGIIGPKRMNYKKVVGTLKTLTDELDTIFRNRDGGDGNAGPEKNGSPGPEGAKDT